MTRTESFEIHAPQRKPISLQTRTRVHGHDIIDLVSGYAILIGFPWASTDRSPPALLAPE